MKVFLRFFFSAFFQNRCLSSFCKTSYSGHSTSVSSFSPKSALPGGDEGGWAGGAAGTARLGPGGEPAQRPAPASSPSLSPALRGIKVPSAEQTTSAAPLLALPEPGGAGGPPSPRPRAKPPVAGQRAAGLRRVCGWAAGPPREGARVRRSTMRGEQGDGDRAPRTEPRPRPGSAEETGGCGGGAGREPVGPSGLRVR